MCTKVGWGLGFKDFNFFNVALLAKQWWRLLKDDSLLCSRIYPAKYCHNSSLHVAVRGRQDSFAWLSLLCGKLVVEEGSLWRVGSVDNIDIWRSKCVPKATSFKIDALDFEPPEARVSVLINKGDKTWNAELVANLFNEKDSSLVQGIQLTSRLLDDALVWMDSDNGQLTVKSAYWVARAMGGCHPIVRDNCAKEWNQI